MDPKQTHGLGILAQRIYTMAGQKSRKDRLALISALVGRRIETTKDLTQREVNRLLRVIPKES